VACLLAVPAPHHQQQQQNQSNLTFHSLHPFVCTEDTLPIEYSAVSQSSIQGWQKVNRNIVEAPTQNQSLQQPRRIQIDQIIFPPFQDLLDLSQRRETPMDHTQNESQVLLQ